MKWVKSHSVFSYLLGISPSWGIKPRGEGDSKV